MIGISSLMLMTILSCGKELLPEPVLNSRVIESDSTKKLQISVDTTRKTIYLSTDGTQNTTKAGSITVDYLKTYTSKAGDSDYFILQSNTSWKIASYPSWLTVSPLSGNGNSNVTVVVKENAGIQRTGSISISGTGVTQNAYINALQLAGSVLQGSVKVDYLKTFSSLAGDQDYFIITSNTSWKIASSPSWVTVSPMSGSGNANVTVTVQSNAGAQRTGTISVSGSGVNQNVSLNALQLAGSVVVPVENETIFSAPFLNFGNVILNKKFVASAGYTKELFVFSNQSLDFRQNYVEANHNYATDLIAISNATKPQSVKFHNNVFQFKNVNNHTLAVGSEGSGASDNFYDGTEFIGNKLTGIGDMTQGQNHAIFLGFNKGGIVKYNFLENCPDAIVLKANGDDNTSGIVSHNLIKNSTNYGVIIKGIQNTKVYNNTFYNDNSVLNWACFIEILKDPSGGKGSTGTIIKNNIFYSTGKQWIMIGIEDPESMVNLQCDYNVYYRAGANQSISFSVNDGSTTHYYSFAQWQALGFDKHSVVVDPGLNSNTLIPNSAVLKAVNLGEAYNSSIDISNTWNRRDIISKVQGSTWQNGAYAR